MKAVLSLADDSFPSDVIISRFFFNLNIIATAVIDNLIIELQTFSKTKVVSINKINLFDNDFDKLNFLFNSLTQLLLRKRIPASQFYLVLS